MVVGEGGRSTGVLLYSVFRILFMGCQTWNLILNVIICHFSGGGMVVWTTTHCFDFFPLSYVLYCLNMCKITDPHMKNQHFIRPAAKKLFFLVISHVPGGGY